MPPWPGQPAELVSDRPEGVGYLREDRVAASDPSADIAVATDPAADHSLDLDTGHGGITVRYAGG